MYICINNEKLTSPNIEKPIHVITSDAKLDHINNPPRKVAKIEDTTRTKQSRETVGGKGSALYRLQQAGMNVPEFTTIDVNTTSNSLLTIKPYKNRFLYNNKKTIFCKLFM